MTKTLNYDKGPFGLVIVGGKMHQRGAEKYDPTEGRFGCGCQTIMAHTFICTQCGGEYGECFGAADEEFDMCDACWSANRAREAREENET